MNTHYADRLRAAVRRRRTSAVVGLDPVLERLPGPLRPRQPSGAAAVEAIEAFGRAVIAAVAQIVPAIKINSAFFEAYQELGVAAYYRLISAAHAAGLLVIADVKRGDIGSTAELYARGHLAPRDADSPVADAVTLHGYLGENAVRPFAELAAREGRGVYVLVRPSDPGADEVHDFGAPGRRFYEHMAALVARWGAQPAMIGDCGLSCVGAVVAPKDAASTAALRAAMPQTPFLVPGYGAQGGDLAACRACFLPGGMGAVVNASRSILYAYSDAAYAARYGDDWAACIAAAARDFAAVFATPGG